MNARALKIWRAAWVAVVGLTVGVAIATWPIYLGRLGEVCDNCPVTPDLSQVLRAGGLSGIQWGVWTLGLQGTIMAVWVGMGLWVFLSRPRDPRALLMAALLSLTGPGFGGFMHEAVAGRPEWWLPDRLLPFLGFACFLGLPLTFPNGRIAPRWSLVVALPLYALFFVNFIFPASRLAFKNWPPLVTVPLILVPMLLLVALVPIYRYRRLFTSQERQQTKWALFGLVLAATALATTLLVVNTRCPSPVAPARYLLYCTVGSDIGYGLGPLMIPVFIGVAILRGRLWDIDVIIRRTLIYALLTGLLALTYFGSIVLLQRILSILTPLGGAQAAGQGQSTLVTVLSTLIIAALFGPLRARVQRVIDQRLYRRKYDAALTLAAFGANVRDETNLDQLAMHLTEVIDEAVRPASVSLWLKGSERER